jgi:hypothetical protein
MGFHRGMAIRTCGYCGLRRAQMNVVLQDHATLPIKGTTLTHSVLSCPDCARLTLLETNIASPSIPGQVKRVIPADDDFKHSIRHLPEDVSQYFADARRVLDAGVPDAAAVQLRRTLEAAAAHFNVSERNLMQSIQKLIAEGLVTKQFGDALHHIRAVGNLGAHASDERVDDPTAQQALTFTTQLLRNLFEVPGDLRAILGEEDTEDDAVSS